MNPDINAPCSSHQSMYKNNSFSTSALHLKHRETTLSLRKKTRDDGFSRQRRLLELEREQDSNNVISKSSIFDSDLIDNLTSQKETLELAALTRYSQLFSSQECIDYFHDMKLTSVVIEIFMRSKPFTDLESACIVVLSKLSTDFGRIAVLINDGLTAKLVNVLNSNDIETIDHAVFLLEEIVRLDAKKRTVSEGLQLIPIAIELYFRFDRLDLRRQILAMVNNYFEYEIALDGVSKKFLDFMHYILLNEADEILLTDAFETIAKISRFSVLHAKLFVENGFLNEASQFLDSDVSQACMSFIESITSYEEEGVKLLSELGYFEKIWAIANSKDQLLKKRGDAFSLISVFISNGYLRVNPGCLNQLISGLIESVTESNFEVRRQSLLAIKELLSICEDDSVLRQCINEKLLGALCDLLTVMHVDTVVNSIYCLEKIMDYAVVNGIDSDLRNMLESRNATDKFEFLTKSNCYNVFKSADRFLEKYLNESEHDALDLQE